MDEFDKRQLAPVAPVLFDVDEEYFGCASSSGDQQGPLPLDEICFPSFAQLIRACQEYAKLSGCRFSLKAFEGIEYQSGARLPVVSDNRSQDEGHVLSAKLKAIHSVRSFADRLLSGDSRLHEDLARAFDMVTTESARNSMIASCKAADLFPPSPAPASVKEDDCSWDEVCLAPAPVIAQKLYNDEVYRLHNIVNGQNLSLVRAKTASFIAEFADEVGVPLPQMSSQKTVMISQFQQDLQLWTERCPPMAQKQTSLSNLVNNAGELASQLATRENLAAAATITVLGAGAIGAALFATTMRSRAVNRSADVDTSRSHHRHRACT